MQAADLLAVLTPAAQGKGGPFAATGKGLGLGQGVGAAGGQGAEGVADAFAQALAGMMAQQGQPVAQTVQPDAPPEGTEETAPAIAGEPKNQGIATAFAATAKGEAVAKGLAKQVVSPTVPTAPEPTGADDSTVVDATPAATLAAAAPTTEDTKGDEDAGTTSPPTAHTLPDTAKADEALASRLASPPPRAERATEVAKGPHPPRWAAKSAAPAPTTQSLPPSQPEVTETTPSPAATAQAAADTAGEQSAALGLAGAQNAKPAESPKAEGKALGKDKDGKGKDGEEVQTAHAPRGVGKGLATAPGQVKKTSDEASLEPPAGGEPETTSIEAADTSLDTPPATFAATDQTAKTNVVPAHADGSKLAAHTVAHLASQIVSRADGRSTRFDVQLDPAGLGKVDVKIEIGRDGQINAAMSFDNPIAAAELRARESELRGALEQAGFDLSKGGLSFDFNGQQGGGRGLWDQQPEPQRPSWARAAFTDLSAISEPASAARHRMIDAGGVDVTV